MNKNILLIEPVYNNKYPPIGLMKISYFHKNILHDHVRFIKGRLPDALSNTKWDHIYVTSLFTYEWANTIDSVKYALTLVDSPSQITVGGIAATLMPDAMFKETGIHPVRGLLNEVGKLGLPGDECIDQLIPDYSILNDVESIYKYPFQDAYFLSATKGCGMKCGFCAVQILEPHYISYMDIKGKIQAIDHKFGAKKDLLLMDNNVLRSTQFDQIIDDIIEAGFGKNATFVNPKTKKNVHRYVDFNQGLDGNLLTAEKARRLGEIALRPARIAFDHIEDRSTYERAIRLCAENGISELSNYLLYNSEDFSGKGKNYHADTPADFYTRMRATLDLKEDINKSLPNGQKVSIFSFPMRYIPLSAKGRGYVGSKWNAKFLRAVQCMLIPTQGKGVGSVPFFEADFGKSSDDFLHFLCMPDKLISARGDFSSGGRGRKDETASQTAQRKIKWIANNKRIDEWNRLFGMLHDEREAFIEQIGDNQFLPEKLFYLKTDLQKKLYLNYLTEPRILALLGRLDKNSPTRKTVLEYIALEFPVIYDGLVHLIASSENQQQYMFKNFFDCFGNCGIDDLLAQLASSDFNADKQFVTWSKTAKGNLQVGVDFELLRIYRRFLDLNTLNDIDRKKAQQCILNRDMSVLGQLLLNNMEQFRQAVIAQVGSENAVAFINQVAATILYSVQLKLADFLVEES